MNRSFLKLAVFLFLLFGGMRDVSLAPVVADWNCAFMAGSNLFNNPLSQLPPASNDLTRVFYIHNVWPALPEGTSVSLWNPSTSSFASTSTFTNGSWTVDLLLPPGTGALVVTPAAFTNTIAGAVLNHDGSLYGGGGTLSPPPVFSGPNGIYLLGDKAPIANPGTNIFINILGRMPYTGEQVVSFSGTSTYLGHGMWDSVPTLAVGEAAFFNIKSEPAPVLTILYTNNQVVVSWPSSPSDWTLQTNSNPSGGTWTAYGGSIANNSVTISPSTTNLFFRLSYP